MAASRCFGRTVAVVVIRRALRAALVAGLAAGIVSAVAWPAWAAAGERGRDGQVRYANTPGLAPLPGEWWFSAWAVQQLVWPLTKGAGVTVAVLDTGVQANVADLRGVIVPGGDATGHHTNGEYDFKVTGDGHGTLMAALIAGQGRGPGMAGIAPEAKILPVVVNAATTDVPVSPGTVATGIVYAANHGARVINISQAHGTASASGCDPAEQAAVAYALARDIVVVAAAGNIGLTGGGPVGPASCAGVLAVGAAEPGGSLWTGSTRQPYVAVAAPGADLITSGRDGRLLTNVNGTRSACALVSGAVALIRSRYPALPWYRVIQRLIGTALPAGGRVPNDSFGYGIVRLDRAVNAAAFPVPASAPNPVRAKYQAWLATPQARSIPRRLGGSAPGPAASRPPVRAAAPRGGGGPGVPVLPIALALLGTLALLAVVAAAMAEARAALASQGRRTPEPSRSRAPSRHGILSRHGVLGAPSALSRYGAAGRHGTPGRQSTPSRPGAPGPGAPGPGALGPGTRGRPGDTGWPGWVPRPERSFRYQDPAYDGLMGDDPASSPGRPYRIPPYSPAPGPGSPRPPWDKAPPPDGWTEFP